MKYILCAVIVFVTRWYAFMTLVALGKQLHTLPRPVTAVSDLDQDQDLLRTRAAQKSRLLTSQSPESGVCSS